VTWTGDRLGSALENPQNRSAHRQPWTNVDLKMASRVTLSAPCCSADVFFETPLFDRTQGVTRQLNWMHFDGGTFLSALPKQAAYLLEAG